MTAPGSCAACGAEAAARAKFCHQCGAPLDARDAAARTGPRRTAIAVYAAAGVSIVAAAVTSALLIGTDRAAPPPAVQTAAPPPSTSSVDLSSVSPRTAADHLFNRVMSANEGGNQLEAKQFAPMAVQAYGRVTSLDADAHYHLGLLHLILDDVDAARAQIAILKQEAPRHLLALVLEHEIAQRTGDAEATAKVLAEFAAAHEAEVATKRPEYEAHRFPIEQLRKAIAAPGTGSAPPAAPAVANAGAALFDGRCAACHGQGASGTDKGPPLVHRIYEPGHHGDLAFRRAVREGVRAHHWEFGDMPPVPDVSDEEIERIVAYVRTLQRASGIE